MKDKLTTREIIEIWKPIKNYEGIYEVSNKGRVRSLDRFNPANHKLKGVILKPRLSRDGYMRINLHKSNIQKTLEIHRLVAEVFIDNSNNLPMTGHWNDIKTDNNINNLYWTTAKENVTHNGMHLRRARKLCKKIQGTLNDVVIVFSSTVEASKSGFGKSGIEKCLAGTRKTHKGYKWERILD